MRESANTKERSREQREGKGLHRAVVADRRRTRVAQVSAAAAARCSRGRARSDSRVKLEIGDGGYS